MHNLFKSFFSIYDSQELELPKGAWRIPGTEEPGGLPLSTGSHRVGHDWSDLAAAARVTAAMKLKDAYSLEGKLWPI